MSNVKNATKNVFFTNEMVDDLMKSFEEDAARIERLASPISRLDLSKFEDGYSEN